jgi:hypothetical protein
MARPYTAADRRQAWDAGVAAAYRHHVDGAQLASPWGRQSPLTRHFRLAASLTASAIVQIRERRP